MGEDVGQPLLRGQAGGVVGGPEQPDGRDRARERGRLERVGPPLDAQPDTVGLHHRAHVLDVLRELRDRLVADPAGAVAERIAGDRVRARRPTDAEVDPPRESGFEERELLGDHQGRVVGQHHSPGPDPDPLGGGGDEADQDRRVGRRNGRHVVVLGQPVALVAEPVGSASQGARRRQGVAGVLITAHRDQVEDGQGDARVDSPQVNRTRAGAIPTPGPRAPRAPGARWCGPRSPRRSCSSTPTG